MVGGDTVTWCLHSVKAGSVIQKPIAVGVHSVDRAGVSSFACYAVPLNHKMRMDV